MQEAVIDYRTKIRDVEGVEEREGIFQSYQVMFTEIYHEELEQWINENQIIHMGLKSR